MYQASVHSGTKTKQIPSEATLRQHATNVKMATLWSMEPVVSHVLMAKTALLIVYLVLQMLEVSYSLVKFVEVERFHMMDQTLNLQTGVFGAKERIATVSIL